MNYGICHLSCIPVREQPDISSEMTTQLLFGEAFEVLETQRNYFRIRQAYDRHEGWLDQRQAARISEDEFTRFQERPFPVTTALVERVSDPATGQTRDLLRGSSLPGWTPEKGCIEFGNHRFPFAGEVSALDPPSPRAPGFEDYARRYLHAPYLWGGRSPFGIDCSGFVQVCFKAFGIRLGRNTTDQIKHGKPVAHFEDRLPGDLAFFDFGSDGGQHVGIVLPQGIIHASAQVRIDDLDERGIRHRETGEITHHLTQIRRG